MGQAELRECPFCGATTAEIYEADDVGGFVAHCLTGCGAQTWGLTETEAIAAWNRRPTAVPDGLAAEISAAIERFHDACPHAQGEQGDGGVAGRAMCQLFYDNSDAIIAALTPENPQQGDRGAEGAEQHLCAYCGAQYALMGAHYLGRISEALDAVGAPKKSPDGNIHYSIFDRIAALNPSPPVEQGDHAEPIWRAGKCGRHHLASCDGCADALAYNNGLLIDQATEIASLSEEVARLRLDRALPKPEQGDHAELIERLRRTATHLDQTDPAIPDYQEAADALTAQSAELVEVRAERDALLERPISLAKMDSLDEGEVTTRMIAYYWHQQAEDARAEIASLREKVGRIEAAVVDDPNWIAEGIPDDAIEAGEQAWEQAERDMEPENYIAGETADWDRGMMVAAIFKAVARLLLTTEEHVS